MEKSLKTNPQGSNNSRKMKNKNSCNLDYLKPGSWQTSLSTGENWGRSHLAEGREIVRAGNQDPSPMATQSPVPPPPHPAPV